jgi:glycosyltransferase involved in cell wall biosynthesis
LNIFSSNTIKKIEKIKPDLVNLHWINNELISIKEISKIKMPIVWTFHDMWPMCGGEHYSDSNRYKLGYDQVSKDNNERGIDLNLFLWRRKKKFWSSKIDHIVCGSKWLKDKTNESDLFKNCKTTIIHPALDLSEWFPVEKMIAREILGLPKNKKILLFMSTNGTKDIRKGFNFIKSLNKSFFEKNQDTVILSIGQESGLKLNNRTISINKSFSGDPISLKLLYSAADMLLVPSLIEAFGQVAIEAASCGTPSVAFKNTGVEDAIKHKDTGYLASYMDQKDFEQGIEWIFNQLSIDKYFFNKRCVEFVSKNFSSRIIANKYINIYKSILENQF